MALLALLITPMMALTTIGRVNRGSATLNGDDITRIRQTIQRLVKSTNSRDLEGVMSVWATDTIQCRPDQPDLDYDALKTNYATF